MRNQGDTPIWHPKKRKEEPEADAEEESAVEADESEDVSEEQQDSEPEQDALQNTYESFADRLPNVKKVRNTRLMRRLTLIISISAVIILILCYFISPFSKLSGVTVTGNENVDSQAVVTDSKLTINDALWTQFFDKSVYEKNIEKTFPRVKKAAISLNGVNSFKIAIEEYQVLAVDYLDGVYYPILENGKVLTDKLDNPISGMPVFANFEDEKYIQSLMDSYNKLPEEQKEQITEIKYSPSESNKELITLYMKDSNQVIVNISQLAEKMKYYSQVAGQMTEPGVIDMEVGIFSYSHKKETENTEGSDSTEESSIAVEEQQ
ncbi:cell division protein FtsQ/DivIB [uncultured Enterococcus sp.]|uniref:cell division protein FtsQ/DivIB n=1 Tax=uncultured Enterococcus sp. TaxID=167972 RepID=UPI002AA793D3|nr:cell division protein FtsQ/DivIB [uncultured Enterococcus sp.]